MLNNTKGHPEMSVLDFFNRIAFTLAF